MSDFTSHLSTSDGFDAVTRSLDDYLKTQNFTALDSYLRGHMAVDGTSVSQLCLNMPADCAHFEPQAWKDLESIIVDANKDEGKVAAIGFDLTGHWESEGPGFEVCLYRNKLNDEFSFSMQSHTKLLSHAKYPTPWQGRFEDCDFFGPIKGLEALYAALSAYQDRDWRPSKTRMTTPDGYTGYFLGLVFLHLRVQETFVRELRQYGLPLAIPVLLGTHDFMGGHFPAYNVLMNTTIAQNVISYEQVQIEKNLAGLKRAKAYTAEQIVNMTRTWVTLGELKARRRTETYESDLNILENMINWPLSQNEITPSKSIRDMNEAEFKSLMEAYYQRVCSAS